jgi:hypothetical protein
MTQVGLATCMSEGRFAKWFMWLAVRLFSFGDEDEVGLVAEGLVL